MRRDLIEWASGAWLIVAREDEESVLDVPCPGANLKVLENADKLPKA